MRNRAWLRWFGSALIVGGAVFFAWYGWIVHERSSAQRRAKEALRRAIANHYSAPESPVHHGDVIGELDIPRLNVSVMIFEGDDAGILERGAGHIPRTALPAGEGNVGIAAHRDTFFRPLRGIRANDVIQLRTPTGVRQY